MGFETARRRGKFWDDAKKIDGLINEFDFNLTEKDERGFESSFSAVLRHSLNKFSGQINTQTGKATNVKGVYCFGKKHRPDMTIHDDGVAIELKLITYEGLTAAIGQAYLYRLQYKFVFLIMIVSERRRSIYDDFSAGNEKDLSDILRHLADDLNIFTYIVPAFKPKGGAKKCHSFFESSGARQNETLTKRD
jgi:hypothetical protein